MRKKKMFVSVSGGRSSGTLAYLIKNNATLNEEYEIIYGFANTTREKKETLIFIDNLSVYFGIPIVWLEADVQPGTGEGTKHKIVSFETAKSDGSVLEAVIQKYGIPCSKTPVCTRESKKYCINSYLRSIGWDLKDVKIAIGYRADEPKRVKLQNIERYNHYYPLWEWGIRKPDIAAFWNKMPFDLGLIDAEGNCKACFKKSDEKILYQALTAPEDVAWIYEMQQKYEKHTPRDKTENAPYRFFRHNRTLEEVLEQYPDFDPLYLKDNSLSEKGANFNYDFDLKEQDDCEESCEPFVGDEEDFWDI